MKGCIFNVQRYSVHDGPGIRTVVFLKGCPLRCKWCSNPESQRREPEIAYHVNNCIGGECLLCQQVCPESAIFYPGMGSVQWEKNKCTECAACTEVCPAEGLTVWGEMRDSKDVLDDVEKDMTFYSRSDGGMTLSGGEPLMQPEFAIALLEEAKKRCIHTAIETTLFADWKTVQNVVSLVDHVLLDIKSIDSEKHKIFTGVDNALILENFRHLRAAFPNKSVRVRTPIVPGFNDNEDELLAIRQLVDEYPGTEYELLKYHRYGQSKYGFLERVYEMGAVELDEQRFQSFKSLVQQKGMEGA